MMNKLTQLNILGLSSNAITKIFTMTDDKDLLRLSEICHDAKDKVDSSILDVRQLTADFEFTYREDLESSLFKDVDDVHMSFSTYFNVLGNQSYSFLRIAMTKLRAVTPIITFKADQDSTSGLQFTLKLEDFNRLLDRLGRRTAGVQWRMICLYDAAPHIIRLCADFFKGKHVNKIHVSPMIVENSDYSPWLTLIRNVSAAEFSCGLSVVNEDDYKFLIELSENVYCASILFRETQMSLGSIGKAMFGRKCVELDFAHNFITHSDLESLLAFFHCSEKKLSFNAFTHTKPVDVQVGAYSFFVYEWQPPSKDGARSVYIMPIEVRERD